MRFIKHGELQDKKIVRSLRRAAKDYENGELIEVRNLLVEIAGAIDEYTEEYERKG